MSVYTPGARVSVAGLTRSDGSGSIPDWGATGAFHEMWLNWRPPMFSDVPTKYVGKGPFRRVFLYTKGKPPPGWMAGASIVWLPQGWNR